MPGVAASVVREGAPRQRVCISAFHSFNGTRRKSGRALGFAVPAQVGGLEQLGEVPLLSACAVRGLAGEPPFSIQHPAVDRQLHVAILNLPMALEVRPGPGQLQDPVVSARGETVPMNRQLQHPFRARAGPAVLAEDSRRPLRVTKNARLAAKTAALSLSRRLDPGAVEGR